MIFYRVFPYDSGVAEDDPGGALYVPRALGVGRIDNPDLYDVLYLGDDPEGAIAEKFGRFSVWRPATLITTDGHPFALGRYEAPGDAVVVDLDDAGELTTLGLRPSDVVSRNRSKTQAWARAVFTGNRGAIGIGWWSYYEPEFHSFGLWDVSGLRRSEALVTLSVDHPSVRAAAQRIGRVVA